MTLSTAIQTHIPFQGRRVQTLNTLGAYFIAEMTALKAQRPNPTPTEVTPVTPIGLTLQVALGILDVDSNSNWQLSRNPWRDENYASKPILEAFVEAYENNLSALIVLYNTPNPTPPPDGYPTTPITKPIPGATIPLVKETLLLYFQSKITASKFRHKNFTPQMLKFLEGWIDFLMLEVFA